MSNWSWEAQYGVVMKEILMSRENNKNQNYVEILLFLRGREKKGSWFFWIYWLKKDEYLILWKKCKKFFFFLKRKNAL